ncbi:MAG: Crp/Fnr family transcriptional regulator [Treponema sp.]|nr:Crp/Fnr family transcriptional regulator [Treponema sp.]
MISKDGSAGYPTRLLFFPYKINTFEKIGSLVKVPKDTVIIEPGDIPQCCYAVKKGCVVGYEYNYGGDERVYNVQMMGSLILDANMFMNIPSPVYFKAVKYSELIKIEKQTLLHEMAEEPRLALDIIESISNKFLAAMDMVREVKCHNTTWMLCNLLLLFSDRYGAPYDSKKIIIKEKISQQILAGLLGVNRITITRIIKKLKALGLIEQINSYYCITDIDKMKQHLDFLDG